MFGTISVEDFSVPHGSTDWDWLDRSPHSFSKIIQFPVKSSSCSSNSNTATTICLTSSKMITVHKRMNSFQSSVQSIQLESPVTVIAQAQAKNCTFGIHRYTETLSLIASGHQNGYISIFHGDSTQLLTRLISHTGPVFGLKFINGNDEGKKTQIISISQDRTAKVWVRLKYFIHSHNNYLPCCTLCKIRKAKTMASICVKRYHSIVLFCALPFHLVKPWFRWVV